MDPETATPSNADSAADQLKQVWTLRPFYAKGVNSGYFSPVLRLQEQQNFQNLEFSAKSFHFYGGNFEFPLTLEEKSWFWVKNP